MLKRLLPLLALVPTLSLAAPAGGTTTTYNSTGTILLDGTKIFPIVLSKGPPRDGTTPLGADALNETIAAGVNFFKVGPATTLWTSADIEDARLWDAATAARGRYTWINLSTLSQAQPGSSTHQLLHQVITTLRSDPGSPGIGMWKGADEPWWTGIPVSSLQFAYCLSTSRGSSSWCANYAPLDADHLWVTIQAPRGTSSDLAPYSAVTDVHGSDAYPINVNVANPDLHQVGLWTNTIASITRSHAVWTTLQICSSGSYNASGFVLPTRAQERYMIYDAIINGARALGFYGGNNPNCWTASDTAYGWNWTFWNNVLKGLIEEINAASPIHPALVNAESNEAVPTNDSSTQAISRAGNAGDRWIIAAGSGSGTKAVTISGLPAGTTTGIVYTEGRSVAVSNGSFTDNFGPWDVHVYRFAGTPPTAVAVSDFAARRVKRAVILSWRTTAETGMVSFNLYRLGGGGTARLNRRPIPAHAGATGSGVRYRFVDRSSGRSRLYRLQVVALDGSRRWGGSARIS